MPGCVRLFSDIADVVLVDTIQTHPVTWEYIIDTVRDMVLTIVCISFQIRELGSILGGTEQQTQIVWTSSVNAHPECFSLDDIQHKHGYVST